MQKVKEIMTHSPVTCRINNSIVDALKVMKRIDCGAVPIVDSDNKIQNIVTDRDIALCLLDNPKSPKDIKLQDCIKKDRKIITIKPEDDIHRAVDLMEEHQVRRLPVCNEHMECVGIVAQADIALKAQSPKDISDLIQEVSEKRTSIGANI